MVALVSDSAHAAAGFAACDLAIGLAPGRSTDFPARADLLAPELGAVAAVVEAGARRGVPTPVNRRVVELVHAVAASGAFLAPDEAARRLLG